MSERAMVGNAADVQQVKKAKKYDKQRSERERADLQSVLESVQGRRFIWKQLCDAGVFRLSFTAGDSHSTAFHEGRRSQGLALLLTIQQLDPTLYHTMAKEAQSEDDMKPTIPETPDTEETES